MSSKSKRKFYRTVIQIEVLSEEPYSETDLNQVSDDITNGHQSGKVDIIVESEEMDGKTAATKLKEQGSDPEFFCLDDHGHDTEDVFDENDEDDDDDGEIHKLKRDK